MENSILTGLAAIAMVLLVVLSGGVIYITLVDWRDRRRLEREKRANNKAPSQSK